MSYFIVDFLELFSSMSRKVTKGDKWWQILALNFKNLLYSLYTASSIEETSYIFATIGSSGLLRTELSIRMSV